MGALEGDRATHLRRNDRESGGNAETEVRFSQQWIEGDPCKGTHRDTPAGRLLLDSQGDARGAVEPKRPDRTVRFRRRDLDAGDRAAEEGTVSHQGDRGLPLAHGADLTAQVLQRA